MLAISPMLVRLLCILLTLLSFKSAISKFGAGDTKVFMSLHEECFS